MFGWLKSDPVKKLDKEYHAKLREAMETQRNGNIRRYAELTEEAEAIRKSIEEIKTYTQKS